MKKIILILLILSISLYSKTKGYYSSGELRYIYPSKINGKLEGTVREFYKDGSLFALWKYKNNKLNGVAETYFKNGKLKNTFLYKQGKWIP